MTPGKPLGITFGKVGGIKIESATGREKIDARTRNFAKTEERAQLVLDITQKLNIVFYEKLFPKY